MPDRNGRTVLGRESTSNDNGNADPTMTSPAGKPEGQNVPPAGGESMAPADSEHPFPPPGDNGPTPSNDADRT